MPTDRKVLVLEVPRSEVDSAVDILDDMSVEGIRSALRSALDKEAMESTEYSLLGEKREGGPQRILVHSLVDARYRSKLFAAGSSLARPWPNRLQQRTITSFEDGAEYRSAWVDCEGEDG